MVTASQGRARARVKEPGGPGRAGAGRAGSPWRAWSELRARRVRASSARYGRAAGLAPALFEPGGRRDGVALRLGDQSRRPVQYREQPVPAQPGRPARGSRRGVRRPRRAARRGQRLREVRLPAACRGIALACPVSSSRTRWSAWTAQRPVRRAAAGACSSACSARGKGTAEVVVDPRCAAWPGPRQAGARSAAPPAASASGPRTRRDPGARLACSVTRSAWWARSRAALASGRAGSPPAPGPTEQWHRALCGPPVPHGVDQRPQFRSWRRRAGRAGGGGGA